MWRRRLAAAAFVALIGAAAWWMLRADDATLPERAPRPSTPATAEEPSIATERKPSRVRAVRPESEPDDRAASKAANETAARKYVERTFVVQTTDAKPIAGATVRVGSADETHATGADGRVRVVVPSEVSLFVRADGFASRVVKLSKHYVTPDVIEMRRPQPVAGIVVDAAGRPVSGATVRTDREVLAAVVTVADGKFAFGDVDPDDWNLGLAVTCDGFVTWNAQVHSGDMDIRATLSRPCRIEGRVVLPDGSPVANAHFDVDAAVSDDGSFEITGLTAGDVVVKLDAAVAATTFVGEIAAHLGDGETLRDVRVELRPLPRSFALLRIVGPSGAAVTFADVRTTHGAVVNVGRCADLIILPLDTAAGSDEEVDFIGVRDGDVDYPRIYLHLVSRAAASGPPDVVTLPPLASLTVDLVDGDGQPSTDPSVSLRVIDMVVGRPETALATQWSLVDAKEERPGQLVFRIGVGTECRVVVLRDGAVKLSRAVTPEERAAGRAVVRLTTGSTVRVRILAAQPGHISEPWFTLRPDVPGIQAMVPKSGVIPDGRYAIEHVPAGKWEARILSCGSIVEKTLAIDVPESGELDLGDVVLPGTTTLHGRVVTADGRPAGGAMIEYFDARRLMDIDGVHALTRTDGTFDVDVPVGATGDLCVAKTDHGGVIVPLDGTSAPLEVRLGVACGLRVTLRGASGRAPSGSVVVMRPGGTALWCPECDYVEHAWDHSITSTYRGFAPGKWVVRIREIDPVVDREVTLVSGETAEVSIDER